jgi:chorismate dehydratase
LGKVRVGAVSYLNTKPLIYGFEQGGMEDEMELLIHYPARVAASLLDNTIDIGLIPVAVIPEMKEHYIISDYCIATEGEVASVCLFSDVPLKEITTILLDYQSRTSVQLLKILVREYWKLNVEYVQGTENYRDQIKGTVAGLVIGDRAFEQRKTSKYIYDLGTAWVEHTSLPFVFAAWVSNKPLDEVFVNNFNHVSRLGFDHLDEVIKENPYDTYDLHTYYTKNISYRLDDQKRKGLKLFLQKLKANGAA